MWITGGLRFVADSSTRRNFASCRCEWKCAESTEIGALRQHNSGWYDDYLAFSAAAWRSTLTTNKQRVERWYMPAGVRLRRTTHLPFHRRPTPRCGAARSPHRRHTSPGPAQTPAPRRPGPVCFWKSLPPLSASALYGLQRASRLAYEARWRSGADKTSGDLVPISLVLSLSRPIYVQPLTLSLYAFWHYTVEIANACQLETSLPALNSCLRNYYANIKRNDHTTTASEELMVTLTG